MGPDGFSPTIHAGPGTPIGDYRPAAGAHLCSVWTDPARDRRAAARFLHKAGQGEGACWVQHPSRGHLPDRVDGVPVAGLRVFSTDDVHLAGGTFDPQRMFLFWRERARESQAAGERHVRAVAEMVWALEERPGTEHASHFEADLNDVLGPLPLSVICQYGSLRFRPDLILAMLLSHPILVIGERVFSNPFFVPGDTFPSRLAVLGADPAGSLIPMWRHFLHRMPTVGEVAALLCCSLPMFIACESIIVHLRGQSRPYVIDISSQRLDERAPVASAGSGWNRLFAVWPSSTRIAGGTVYTATRGDCTTAEVTFEGGRGTIVLSGRDAFTPGMLMLFTTLVSDVGAALADLQYRGMQQPLGQLS